VLVLRFFAALFLFGLGCAYIWQKDSVLRLNAFMRDRVFRDAYVLLDGRRVGSILILLGLILLILSLKAPS